MNENKIKIIGSKKSIKDTKEEILILFEEAKKGVNIDEDKIMETRSLKLLEISPDEQMNLFFQTKKRKISPRTKNQKNYFVLDSVNDPGNLGTMIRTLDWFGYDQLICSKNF